MHINFRIRSAGQNVVAIAATLNLEFPILVFQWNYSHLRKPVMQLRIPEIPEIFTTASPKACFVDRALWQQDFAPMIRMLGC